MAWRNGNGRWSFQIKGWRHPKSGSLRKRRQTEQQVDTQYCTTTCIPLLSNRSGVMDMSNPFLNVAAAVLQPPATLAGELLLEEYMMGRRRQVSFYSLHFPKLQLTFISEKKPNHLHVTPAHRA